MDRSSPSDGKSDHRVAQHPVEPYDGGVFVADIANFFQSAYERALQDVFGKVAALNSPLQEARNFSR